MNYPITPRTAALPPIVRIVLRQIARHRTRGAITEERFEAQLQRLVEEELEPRGFELLTRHISDGRTRFLIKAKATGVVCDLIEAAIEESSEDEHDETEFTAEAQEDVILPGSVAAGG